MLISGFFGTEPTGPNRACGSTASGGFSRWQPEDWPVSPCFLGHHAQESTDYVLGGKVESPSEYR